MCDVLPGRERYESTSRREMNKMGYVLGSRDGKDIWVVTGDARREESTLINLRKGENKSGMMVRYCGARGGKEEGSGRLSSGEKGAEAFLGD